MFPFNDCGSYLIRESENIPGGYALSVRDTRSQVQHYKIYRSEKQEFYITAHYMFKTLQDLVIHYQQQADGLCVNLKKPCAIIQGPTDVFGEGIIDEWQTDRSSIRLVRKLKSGEFTEVWEGMWNNTRIVIPVAVKMLKPQRIVSAYDFLQSANLMKKLQHPNLVHLYALCSKEAPIFIITELMQHGSLLEYLHSEGESLKLPQLLEMAAQVAAGMAYLEEQNVIHRDLAARNIQVGEGIVCKVANFELAQVVDIDELAAIYKGGWALWAAPEVILYKKFSIKSDVWSFGIVLYEIITCGESPYPGMINARKHYRIDYGWPEKLCDIIWHNCLCKCPNDRPTFATLQWKLEDLISSNYGDWGKLDFTPPV
jgi:fyn-related kinase